MARSRQRRKGLPGRLPLLTPRVTFLARPPELGKLRMLKIVFMSGNQLIGCVPWCTTDVLAGQQCRQPGNLCGNSNDVPLEVVRETTASCFCRTEETSRAA